MEEPTSWWLDAHNRPPNQSQWLRAILSDLDGKIKTIVNLIEDDGDSFTERADLFHKRRPELLKILHELHQSYKILAVSYDEIRSTDTARISQFRSPFSSFRFQQKPPEDESPNPDPQKDEDSIAEGSEDEEEEKPEVLKLMEDNLRQQMELIRRNEEKREMIKQLKGQVSRLMEENRAMKGLISSYKPEFQRSDSNNFKLKGLNCLGSFHSPN